MKGYKVPEHMIGGFKNMIARYPKDAEYAWGMNAVVEAIESLPLEELDDNWHTGTPTEEGWYLVAYQHKDKITYRAVRFFLEKGLDMEFLDSEGGIYYPDIWKAVAWQKIEPYRG